MSLVIHPVNLKDRQHFKSGATPVFVRAREIPLALREAYAKEIDAKIASGFYEKVEHSE